MKCFTRTSSTARIMIKFMHNYEFSLQIYFLHRSLPSFLLLTPERPSIEILIKKHFL